MINQIDKFKHGSEISSEHLNKLVEAINEIITRYHDISDIKSEAKETLNNLDVKMTEIFDQIQTVPQIKELYASILLARDSVNWIEIPTKEYTFIEDPEGAYVYDYESKTYNRYTEDMGTDIQRYSRLLTTNTEAEELAKDLANLESNSNDAVHSAQRLTIIRGRLGEDIGLDKPALKDKQILLGYSTGPAGTTTDPIAAIFFDVYIGGELKRIPVTANGPVQIVAEAPTFRIVKENNGEEIYLEMRDPQTDEITRSINLKGATGRSGTNGRDGVDGHSPKIKIGPNGNWEIDDEDTGVRATGRDGAAGSDGASLTCSVQFSNYSDGRDPTDVYLHQTYMGLKFYKETATQAEINATPRKWIRIAGDTLYPSYNSDTGLLTFSTTKPNGVLSFNIKGDRGDKGDVGPAPHIAFKGSNKNITPVDTIAPEEGSSVPTYVFDINDFQGAQGPKGDTGETGQRGPEGPQATFNFKVQTVDHTDTPSIEDITSSNSNYSYEYLLKVPKGKPGENGLTIKEAMITNEGRLKLQLTNGDPSDMNSPIIKTIDLGIVKGDKGDKGDPATISIKTVVNSKYDLPLSGVINGDAYIVKETNPDTNELESNLYICVDSTKTTVEEMYESIGNIKGEKGDKGKNGSNGRGIEKIELINDTMFDENGARINAYQISYTDDTYSTIYIKNGIKGDKGDQGEPGQNARITIEAVDTLDPGSQATIINSTPSDQDPSMNVSLRFGIPAGTVIHTQDILGSSGIDNALGRNGDFCLIRDTGSLYQKVNGSWVAFTGLKGVNGATIRTSNGEPVDSFGAIGDLCIDTTTGNVYHKPNNFWSPTSICLKGTPGQDGDNGPRGATITFLDQSTQPVNTVGYQDGDIIITNNFNVYSLMNIGSTLSWTLKGSIKGRQGDDGHTPVITIGDNGNWKVDGTDTGVKAQGPKGEPGAKGDALKVSVKKRLNSVEELNTITSFEQGDAYLIIETEGDSEVNNLYVCLNPTASSILDKFTNLGNIKGEKGSTGNQGEPGRAATIYVDPVIDDSVTTPSVTNSGTINAARLKFSIPKGAKGDAATISIGTVEPVDSNQPPQVWNGTGDPSNVSLNFKIPVGKDGTPGKNGTNGVSPYIGENGHWFSVTDESPNSAVDTGITAQGPNGNDGKDGIAWHYGTELNSKTATISTTITAGNKVGDFYLNTDKGYVYTCISTTTWKYLMCIKPIQDVSVANGVISISRN